MTTEPDARRQDVAAIVDRISVAPIGSRRIEDALAWLMSVFGVLFSLQSIPGLVDEWRTMVSALGLVVLVLVYGSIALAGLASVLRQWTRPVFLAAGAAFLVGLLLWPAALVRPLAPDGVPWMLSLSGVACGFVVIAVRSAVVPIAYTLLVGGAIVLIRSSPVGGGLEFGDAVFESGYGVIVSLALLTIVSAIRLAARSVDQAQGTALARYAGAQIDEATEAERTRTDALVHDSVLTTFLSAAAAATPEARALATRMARNTMNVLSRATVASLTGPKVAVHDLLARVQEDAAGLGDQFEYAMRDVEDHLVPEPVADAVVSAAVQAMTNSVKHAGGPEVPRSVVVEGADHGGVRVIVQDRGRGFDPKAVASERLGLRVSIMERMARVGGEVDLRTAPGQGTVFVLSWPASARTSVRSADDPMAVTA